MISYSHLKHNGGFSSVSLEERACAKLEDRSHILNRRYGWLPVLAAPTTVIGHIVSEAIASGRDVFAVAWEPQHLLLLVLALLAFPIWSRAANRRRLGYTIAAVVALSLLLEGNGLSAAALGVAVAISTILGFFGGWAIESADLCAVARVRYVEASPPILTLPSGTPPAGPYFAFVATRGNRPPPVPLGQR